MIRNLTQKNRKDIRVRDNIYHLVIYPVEVLLCPLTYKGT
jgi:hypothetical protein